MSPSPLPAHAVRETPASTLPAPSPSLPPVPERDLSLPRPAQWTAGTLLAALVLWLGIHGIANWIESFQPSPAPRLQLDLNTSSRDQLAQLPGVGPSRAERIAAHRERHGPFQSLNDLRRVPGIGPAMMEKLRQHAFVASDPKTSERSKALTESRLSFYPATEPRPKGKSKEELNWTGPPLDINTASILELQRLPAIGPKLSERIVEFRTAKRFTSVEDLRKVSGIGPKTLEKVRPYIVVTSESAVAGPVE